MSYRPFIREAIQLSSHKPRRVIIWQRNELRWDDVDKNSGERNWYKLVRSCRARNVRAACVPVGANEEVYIIYTSDIGWVVGHSYILYGPLLAGAATVLYEGKPVGTPDSSAFWRIVQEYNVSTLFTAPTALRAIKRDDSENTQLRQIGERGGLRSLRAIFLAGERSEPSIIMMYQELVGRYAAPGALVVDNWWSSESGSPITGISLAPHTSHDKKHSYMKDSRLPPVKPGSAGKAMPGFDVRCVDDDGVEVKPGKMGNIVLGIPLAPTGFITLWNDEERFYKSYLKRFDGKWIDTGDAGIVDAEGYISIMSRSDDLINTAGHRLSTGTPHPSLWPRCQVDWQYFSLTEKTTGSIEQAITSHSSIAEACVVGIPDSLKGQLPFAFITLSMPDHPLSAIPNAQLVDEIQQQVRKQIGGIATLGGIIQGKGMIPKTRSGKTLRRVLRELVENAVHGEYTKDVQYPATIEDPAVIDVAREKVAQYFQERGDTHKAIEARAKL
ncbi:hypothetical protein NPX13_g2612 [Xylaria arbuscula]|uniref:AMP-dependent synthetase/ligase domain-containing protein n=1 Tax=Xylaria arbuscula TaxID=114810 RepID=A0A9W8NJV8_9PEZI|nr:hypothetical protein NPX13_g2612 [Xylaria arbuscula]